MTYNAIVYRILIASPSDLINERKIMREAVQSWNVLNSTEIGAVVLPVMWETHCTPEMGDRPQALVNKQIVEDCDILIGAFWTRIGTETGEARSGTVEEIERFRKAGKPVMLYFSSQPVVPNSIDLQQYELLKSYKNECQKEGLVEEYSSSEELNEKINRHLTITIRKIHGKTVNTKEPTTESQHRLTIFGESEFRKQLEDF
jgi:hypothetical protein